MGPKLGDLEIIVGILFILGFTAFIAYLTFQPATTTTTSMTTTTAAVTSSSTTSSSTTTTTTSKPAASTSSSTTAVATTTTMFTIECAANEDCGKEHYDGTYICLTDGPTTALQNCTPKCVHGACTERCEIAAMFDRCNRTQICIPGRRYCVDRDRFENTTEIEIFYDKYVTYRGYQFRLNFTSYQKEYEVRGLFIDVIPPGGGQDRIIVMWDIPADLDDLEAGLYGVKRNSAIIWLQKMNKTI